MLRPLRLAIALSLLIAAGVSLDTASAQMMHFTLNVVIQTDDGADIPAGQVCVSGEVNPICQDIPTGTPYGREFSFPDLADGDHEVTVSAEPYLEAVDEVTLTDNESTITVTLVTEQTPPTEAAPSETAPTEVAPIEAAAPTEAAGANNTALPNTGTGAAATADSPSALALLIAAGLVLGLCSLVLTRRRRTR